MAHIYTRASEYGLRALQAMAQEPDRRWTAREICDAVEIPEQFTRKVMQILVRDGLLVGTRGPTGGFSFARPPDQISLSQVIAAVDSGSRFDLCIMGFQDCSDAHPCPLHHLWVPIKEAALRMLADRTVADLGPTLAAPRRAKAAGKKRSKTRKGVSKVARKGKAPPK